MTRRLYRLLVYLYPSELRERFAEEMIELAHHQRRHPLLLARDFLVGAVTAHVEAWRRRPRSVGGGGAWTATWKDFEVAFRGLRSAPGFAVIAVATIGLGIGANTAIFSVVNGVVLRPLPYDDAERLVTVRSVYTVNGRLGPMSFPDVADIQQTARTFDAVAAYRAEEFSLTDEGEAEVVRGARVGGGLFDTLGVHPVLGRDIVLADNVVDGPRIVVVGYDFWQERFGGGPNVLGTRLTMDDVVYEIVGVAPAGFDFPERAEVWQPLYSNVDDCGRGCHILRTLGRLSADATIERAGEELSVLAAQLSEAHSDTNAGKVFAVTSLNESIVGSEVRTALFVLFAAVGVVLLIASANVAHLLLARSAARTDEIAVRSALGASRLRILRQLFIESIVLAGLGTVAGLLLARWWLSALLALAPADLPRVDQIALDGSVLLFALIVAVAASLLFGLVPALSASRAPSHSRRGLNRGLSGSRPMLLAAEVALSLVLLFGAGLLLRSFSALRDQPLGFDPDNVLTFTVSLPDARYEGLRERSVFFETLESELFALPDVDAVGTVYGSPMGLGRMSADVTFFDRPEPPPGEMETTVIRAVTPGYVGALGVALVRGRGLEQGDRHGGTPVALVNASFAERFFPGRDPIGEKILVHASFGFDETEPRTIVGVVGDVRSRRVSEPAVPEVWAPQAQMGSSYMTVLVRTRNRLEALLPEVRATVRGIDPNVPIRSVETLASAVARNIGANRFYFLLLTVFAGLAVLLASIGLYGVVSYLVSTRRKEIGLRMALGADASDVARLIVMQGLRPTLVGVAAGLVGACLSARLLQSLLYNVGPLDATSLALATISLLLVATVALWIPARRASLISPTSTLRLD